MGEPTVEYNRDVKEHFVEDVMGGMPQCFYCRRQNKAVPWTCEAYPKGIPLGIRINTIDHHEPHEGDHGLRFKPIVPAPKEKGGEGSGNWGHAGRPGVRGGSAPGGGGVPYAPRDAHMELVRNKVIDNLYHSANRRGMSVPDARDNIVENLQDHVDSVPVSIRRKQGTALLILEDGRFKTQYEVGRSGGTYDPEFRSDAEFLGMGVPGDIDPKLRPVYGYFDHKKTTVGMYGNVEFVLKDSVKARTTVTVGDSLYSMRHSEVIGVPAKKISVEAADQITDYLLDDSAADWQYVGYIEAQVHGGVTMEDVSKIIVHAREFMPVPIMEAAAKHGIEVEIDRYSD